MELFFMMKRFGFFGRKSLPDLDEEINLDDASLNDDSRLLDELKQELEELKMHQPVKTSHKKPSKSKKIKDFDSIVEIEYFLKEIDDDFFKQHSDLIKQKVISFIDKMLPETALSFEVSLLADKDKLLDKIHVIREVYGDLTLTKNSKKRIIKSQQSQTSLSANSKEKLNIKDTKNSKLNHEPESQNKTQKDEPARQIDSDEQIKAIHILRLLEPKESMRLGSKRIRSLEELKDYVESLPEKEFNLLILPLHKRKNLVHWIDHVLGYPELSEKLMLCETREEIHSVLDEMFEKVKDLMLYGKQNDEPQTQITLSSGKSNRVINTPADASSDANSILKKKEEHKTKEQHSSLSNARKKVFGKPSLNTKSLQNEITAHTDDDEQKADSKVFSQYRQSNLNVLLDQLILLSDDEFKQKKNEILRVLFQNKVSRNELLVFLNRETKADFTDALEEFLYSRPEFESRVKALSKKKINSLMKTLNLILEENTDTKDSTESFNKTTQVNEIQVNESKVKKNNKKIKLDNISTKKRAVESLNRDRKTKVKKEQKTVDAFDNVKNDREENSRATDLVKQQTSNLENSFTEVIQSYKKNNVAQLKSDENFFNYVSQLKQELEEIKQKNSKIVTLPPPTLDNKTTSSTIEKGLFDLIKPEVDDSSFDERVDQTRIKLKTESREKSKGDLLDNLLTEKSPQDERHTKPRPNEKSVKSAQSTHSTTEVSSGKSNSNLSIEELEEQLLEEEHKLLEKKIQLIQQKRKMERENLNQILQNLKLNDVLLSKLSESNQESPRMLNLSNKKLLQKSSLDLTQQVAEEKHSPTRPILPLTKPEQVQPQEQVQILSSSPLKHSSNSSMNEGIDVPQSKELTEVKKDVDGTHQPIKESNIQSSSKPKVVSSNQAKDNKKLMKSSERNSSQSTIKLDDLSQPDSNDILENIDNFSLKDLVNVVDEFLLNDSFNEAKQIILKAKKLVGKRSRKQNPLKLEESVDNKTKPKQSKPLQPPKSESAIDREEDNSVQKSPKNNNLIKDSPVEKSNKNVNFNITLTKDVALNPQRLNQKNQKCFLKSDDNAISTNLGEILNKIVHRISNDQLDEACELIQKAGKSNTTINTTESNSDA